MQEEIIDTVRTFTSIEAVAEAWQDLAVTTRAAPFLWPGWITAWRDAFAPRDPVTVVTVWRDDRLVALLPLLGEGACLASPTNDQTPLFGPLASDEEAAVRLVDAVVAQRPGRLRLGYLDPDIASTAHAITALRARGYRALTEQTLRAPFTDVAGAWDDFAKRLGKKRRAELRRSERRLREQGDLQVQVHAGGSDLDAVLDEGFRVEAAGWKGREGTAITSTATMREFYTSVAHWAAAHGLLHLVFLRLDGRAIAFEFILRHDGVLYDVKGGYDEDYRTWGPGIWLMQRILQQAFADDTRFVEWLGTDDGYKLEWSDGTRQHVTSIWLAPTVRGRTEYHTRHLWRTSRRRANDALRERLPEATIERLKDAKNGAMALRSRG